MFFLIYDEYNHYVIVIRPPYVEIYYSESKKINSAKKTWSYKGITQGIYEKY